ncbi:MULTISPECIES: ABC transporter permease [unclassified Gordonia (in: high G+C Gram-positive bacteria)]|uniref:ABC transporter permease n=1 Tax=unclassified Gordonia (in: high G+C Gram-positive bacteria) TaxID=2657482 RepID=UPI00071CE4A4|nr:MULTISPECIES: ABC transporter permease [unclassified Gordonia (in: high G+C Gram-positive bacteria)]KSU55767.1 ABC transporter permease [Gordonia sp. SGD-V-85]SCC50278.1 ABC-2 type transport system permease protein [Gordonia sp. v-85]
MTTLAHTVSDSRVMVRRNVRRLIKFPVLAVMLVGIPVVFLLLFVFVFGGQLGAGMTTQSDDSGRAAYLDYVVPGIVLVTVASAVQGTAIVVAMDMTSGIINRFRTMDIARSAVLTGHVLASLLQALFSIVVVLAVAVGIGFRPSAGPLDWLGAFGVTSVFSVALIWLSVYLGLAAKSVETASNTAMFLTILPFLSTGFVPAESLPTGLRQFAEYQPFTPVIEVLRGTLTDAPVHTASVVASLAWSLAIGGAAFFLALRTYERRRIPG